MSASRKSRWPTILVVAALAGASWWGYSYWKSGPGASSAGTADLRTNRVSIGNITNLVTANGALNPVRIVTVGSQISGIITEINVDFNSRVKEGDILAKVDSSTYE